jgi:hypothetical protein
MAKRKKKGRKGKGRPSCKRVRIKGHTKVICRSKRTGRIVRSSATGTRRRRKAGTRRKSSSRRRKSSGNLICPSRSKGRKVHIAKGGGCYIKLKSGKARFVKKVRPSRARMRMV